MAEKGRKGVKMTVEALIKETGFKTFCLPTPEKEIEGAYVGDLLSWVMGNAESGNLWITIMSNNNVIAVASLLDFSCIILAEGVIPENDFLTLAKDKCINVLSSKMGIFELCAKVFENIKE
jgi:hypothetical protein